MDLQHEKDSRNAGRLPPEVLRAKRVAVVGAGGLGSPAAVQLVGAGVGVTLIDGDEVSLSNLNRQFLYVPADEGKPKAATAAARLAAFAPDCEVTAACEMLTDDNAERLLAGSDLVLAATDNNAARFAANRWCVRHAVPLVSAGVAGGNGTAYLYEPGRSPCLACCWPEAESPDKRTLAAVAGAVSSLAAALALRALCGDFADAGRLFLLDVFTMTLDRLPVKRLTDCPVCGGATNGR